MFKKKLVFFLIYPFFRFEESLKQKNDFKNKKNYLKIKNNNIIKTKKGCQKTKRHKNNTFKKKTRKSLTKKTLKEYRV